MEVDDISKRKYSCVSGGNIGPEWYTEMRMELSVEFSLSVLTQDFGEC